MGVGQPVPTAHSPWKPSALHWPAGGRSARDACPPPSLSPASISLPSALTSLTSHPISLLWGEAGKGVIRSCPPLHLFPLTPLPTLIPYPGLLSSPTDGELPTRGASPPPTPALMPKAPLPNWGFSPQIGNRKHSGPEPARHIRCQEARGGARCAPSRKGLRLGSEFGSRLLSDWEISQGRAGTQRPEGFPQADQFLLGGLGTSMRRDGSVRLWPASTRLLPTGGDGPKGTH